ncbi:chromate transporter [Aminobacter aminovorans]|uniref:Chromate transporter, chromate ion transporter (CHR) family n=1 Tax=Aminobacter aminovorans TaxID=83263 RepID=A0A380WL58_AMIAI|nr:chromate efflux transporter [Aminobacter aminovorans]TCS29031.1 chromate transporter [Aminobacter aminovorans]SUU88884.1 chromate transporter, chromate ion transporter (CHR) family [Aminobacter aminovorans]
MDTTPFGASPPSFGEATRTFARIGLLSFGGPAGQIALMHKILVDEKRWLDEPRFLHALNYCMLLPGPEAMQLATYAGWLMHGIRGGLMAGLLFVLPGALVIIALSAIYMTVGHVTLVQGLLFGLKAAVLAVVLEALIKVSKRALKNVSMVILAIAAFVAIAFLKLPFPLIIAAAAIIGAMVHLAGTTESRASANAEPEIAYAMPEWTQPTARRFFSTLAVWLAIWFGPLIVLWQLLGPAHVFTAEATFFSKMAAVTFGGAYAVLAYVAQQAVEVHGWLKPDEMLTGLGLAETTPGPLILVLAFVGFLGGARLSALAPLAGGIAGAVVTLWFTFVPCFLWIFVGAPYVETVRNVRWLASALSAVTAAVVGIIANLAVWFALHVLFGNVGEVNWGPFALPVLDFGSFDWLAATIAVAAGVALIRFHANMMAVLAASALAGMAWQLS